MRSWSLMVAGMVVIAAGIGLADDTAKKPDGKIEIAVAAKTETLDEAVKKNKGKVIVIDFWATWCKPCVEKFPHLVELHKKHAEKGLVCMSASLDDADDKEMALKFLKEKGAAFPNFLLTATGKVVEQKLEDRYGLEGGIPHMAVFSRSGEKVWDSRKKKSEKELDALIEAELVKK
jgi:thiol-disulfide isomerase/thioredoxin